MKQLGLGIIVAIALTLPAFGQSSLKEQLVGTWAHVSCTIQAFPWCSNPNNGIHILGASGHYATVNALRGRPKFTATNPGQPRDAYSAEEYKAAAMGLQAQFGTWLVNEVDKTITYHVDGALFPNVEGAEFNFTVNLSGDEMTLVNASGPVVVWRRVKN